MFAMTLREVSSNALLNSVNEGGRGIINEIRLHVASWFQCLTNARSACAFEAVENTTKKQRAPGGQGS